MWLSDLLNTLMLNVLQNEMFVDFYPMTETRVTVTTEYMLILNMEIPRSWVMLSARSTKDDFTKDVFG